MTFRPASDAAFDAYEEREVMEEALRPQSHFQGPVDLDSEDWEVFGAQGTSLPAPKPLPNSALARLDAEIASIDTQIHELQGLRQNLSAERKELVKRHEAVRPVPPVSRAVADRANAIDFFANSFDWDKRLKDTMRDVWGISGYRSQQQGVVNAVMSGRDCVVIMPTGAGKSLCFQLPALLTNGTTICISPLIALMNDQVLNLQDMGVAAAALTSASSKSENDRTLKRLLKGGPQGQKSRVRIIRGDEEVSDEPELKLLYITPERFAKSKTLLGALTQLSAAGRLARFVIDEAHCVSQMGHDFRQDYKKLALLKQLYPSTPIVALTATCPPRVLDDMLKILSLRPPTKGKAANGSGTVLFQAPLYRPNLHWSVLPKPANAKEALQILADWITEHHEGETGIVYCLSQKDTETVAEGLRTASGNKIKTGVYHAGLDDAEKDRVHHRWRDKHIRVVVATCVVSIRPFTDLGSAVTPSIAFGLGIDKPDVRFVAHHTLSKSLEGLYQEAGRAGRDGKDSDCVLFFRTQDASRLASVLAGDPESAAKLRSILGYAQDRRTCRKILFARYFAGRSVGPFATTSNQEQEDETECGHCDNCLRDPASIETVDARVDAWRMLKVLEAVRRLDGRVTSAQLADLSRGLGGGGFSTQGEKGKAGKASIDIAKVAGAKVSLNKDDAETLAVELELQRYITDMLHGTAYSVVVYQKLGDNAMRLLRLSFKDIEQGKGPKVEIDVPVREGKGKRKAAGGKASRAKKKRRIEPEDSLDFDDSTLENILPPLPALLPPIESDDVHEVDEDGLEWEDVTPALPQRATKPKSNGKHVMDLSD